MWPPPLARVEVENATELFIGFKFIRQHLKINYNVIFPLLNNHDLKCTTVHFLFHNYDHFINTFNTIFASYNTLFTC